METYRNLKKGTKVGLSVFSVLFFAELILSIVAIFISERPDHAGIITLILHDVGRIVLLSVLLTYTLIGYKKPHGNLLKIVFLAFSVYLVFFATLNVAAVKTYVATDCDLIAALMIAYVAGRLDRWKKNLFLLAGAEVLLLVGIVFTLTSLAAQGKPINLFSVNGQSAVALILLFISFAYIARYEEHKAAGLADKADAEEN